MIFCSLDSLYLLFLLSFALFANANFSSPTLTLVTRSNQVCIRCDEAP
jgi:hypothetical protein